MSVEAFVGGSQVEDVNKESWLVILVYYLFLQLMTSCPDDFSCAPFIIFIPAYVIGKFV